MTGFRKSARAAKILDGLLPPPIKLGGKAAGFLAHELAAIIGARASGATDDDIRAVVKRLIADRSKQKAA